MTALRQRDPRERDREYLGYIGYLPSPISGGWPVQRAHIRYAEACPVCYGKGKSRQFVRAPFSDDLASCVEYAPCISCQGTRYRYGKRPVGASEKPSDKWSLPLTPEEHLLGPYAQHQQHGAARCQLGEREWWEKHGIDPLALCVALQDAWNTALSTSDAIEEGRRIVRELR